MTAKEANFTIKFNGDTGALVQDLQKLKGVVDKLDLSSTMKANFTKVFSDLEKSLGKVGDGFANGLKDNRSIAVFEQNLEQSGRLLDKLKQGLLSIPEDVIKKAFTADPQELKDITDQVDALNKKINNEALVAFGNLEKKLEALGKETKAHALGDFISHLKSGDIENAARDFKKLQTYFSRVTEGTDKYAVWKQAIDAIGKEFEKLLPSVTATEAEIGKLNARAENLNETAGTEGKQSIDNIAQGLDDVKNSSQQAGQSFVETSKDANGLQKELDGFKNKVTYFFGLNNAVRLFQRALRSAFETVKDLDKVMTETAVVTEFSVGDMWTQLPEYTKRANELGVSIHDVYEASTLYYQQGLKTNEVMAVTNATLKMARIAGLEASEATDRMTNALRGFNMEITEANANNIADVYSKLAAITASNVDEISTAMTKTASLAASANMSFENTAAFLAQIIETTRESAETAGTALKTVIARFSEVKKLYSEGELLGTDAEGEAIDINKVSAALRTAGIDMNEFLTGAKGLDEVFIELASKWNSLTLVQQRYIATMAAGSRQQSRFIALMSDYQRTMQLTGAANNAAGASTKQYEKTLESFQTKLTRLKNAYNEFILGITDSTVVKGFVDLLTELVGWLNKITSSSNSTVNSIKKISLSIGLFAGAKGIFKVFEKKLLTSLPSVFKQAGEEGSKSFLQGFVKAFDSFSGKLSSFKQNNQINNLASSFIDLNKLVPMTDNEMTRLSGTVFELADRCEELNITRDQFNQISFISGKLNASNLAEEQKQLIVTKALKDSKYADTLATKLETDADLNNTVALEANNLESSRTIAGKVRELQSRLANKLGLEAETKAIHGQTVAQMSGQAAVKATNTVLLEQVAILGVYAAVIAVVVALLVAAIKMAQNTSLTGQLDLIKKTSDELNESLNELQSNLDNLTNVKSDLSSLNDGFKELERGTEAWRTQLNKANSAVLDILEENPELASSVTIGEYGQLTIEDDALTKLIEKQTNEIIDKQQQSLVLQLQSVKLENEQKIKDKIGYKNSGGLDYTTFTNVIKEAQKAGITFRNNLDESEIESLEHIFKQFNLTTDQLDKFKEQVAKTGMQFDEVGIILANEDSIEQSIIQSAFTRTDIAETEAGAIFLNEFSDTATEIFRQLEVQAANAFVSPRSFSEISTAWDLITGSTEPVQREAASEAMRANLAAETLETIYKAFEEAGMTGLITGDVQLGTQFGLQGVRSPFLGTRGTYVNVEQPVSGINGDQSFTFTDLQNGIGASQLHRSQNLVFEDDAVSTLVHDYFIQLNMQFIETAKQLKNYGINTSGLSWNVGQALLQVIQQSVAPGQFAKVIGRFFSKDILAKLSNEEYNKALEYLAAGDFDGFKKYLISLGKNIPTTDLEQFRAQLGAFNESFKLTNLDELTKNLKELDGVMSKLAEGTKEYSTEEMNQMIESGGANEEDFIKIGDDVYYFKGNLDEVGETMAQKSLEELIAYRAGMETPGFYYDAQAAAIGKGTVYSPEEKRQIDQQILSGYSSAGARGIRASGSEEEMAAWDEGLRVLIEKDYPQLIGLVDELGTEEKRAAALVAISNEKARESFKDLTSAIQDNLEVLKDEYKGTDEYAAALASVTQYAKEAFGEDVTSKFVSDNLELFRDFANGVEGSTERIQMAILSAVYTTESDIANIQTVINSINGAEFDIYGHADLSEIITELLDVGLTAEQVTNYLTSLEGRGFQLEPIFDEDGNMVGGRITNLGEQQRQTNFRSYGGGASKSSGGGSSSKAWENPYDELYNLTQKINTQLREREKLEKDYDRLLQRRSESVEEIKQKSLDILAALYHERDLNQQLLEGRRQQAAKILNQAYLDDDGTFKTFGQMGMAKYGSIDVNTGEVQINYDLIDSVTDAIEGARISAYISALEEAGKNIQDTTDEIEEIDDKIYEEQQRGKQDYLELEERTYQALVNQQQKVIDGYKTLSDAITDANQQIISSLRESVDMERQIRDNTKKEEDIADKEARLAYLRRDTSGANDTEIMKLEKELGEAREQYADSLVDQAIADLEDQNEKASEQRQKQIDLMQSQLNYWSTNGHYWKDVHELIKTGVVNGKFDPNSSLVKLLRDDDNFSGLSVFGQQDWMDQMAQQYASAMTGEMYWEGVDLKETGRAEGQLEQIAEASKRIGTSTGGGSGGSSEGGGGGYIPPKTWGSLSADEKYAAILHMTSAEEKAIAKLLGIDLDEFDLTDANIYSKVLTLLNLGRFKLSKFASGGLVTSTGPAWLDGSLSSPEMVLNAKDTANLIQLKSILAQILSGGTIPGGGGDNYYNIDINVDELASDYDVDKIAARIKQKIYDDSIYRNVNAINYIR